MAGLVASIIPIPALTSAHHGRNVLLLLHLSADTRVLFTDDSLPPFIFAQVLAVSSFTYTRASFLRPSSPRLGFEHPFSMCDRFNGSSAMAECQTDHERDQVCSDVGGWRRPQSECRVSKRDPQINHRKGWSQRELGQRHKPAVVRM